MVELVDIPVVFRRNIPHYLITNFIHTEMLRREINFEENRKKKSSHMFLSLTNDSMVEIVSVVCGSGFDRLGQPF